VAASQQGDHLRDPRSPQLRPALRRIDPPQVSLAVEGREGVPERSRIRMGCQSLRDVVGQVIPRRAFEAQLGGYLGRLGETGVLAPESADGENQPPTTDDNGPRTGLPSIVPVTW
jgi:hypothetical protein